MTRKYAEMRPEELAAALVENPLVICPWGALEWHGTHLPLGLDGVVAEAFSERLAEATGGILLPGIWLPITALPHAYSISIPTDAVGAVWRALLDELARVGAGTICIVTGHYAQGHELEMYRECRDAMARHTGVRVLGAAPLELLHAAELLDHAGRSEAAQLMAVRPDLVRLDLYEDGGPVLGKDPRGATRAEGEALLRDGLAAWVSALNSWSSTEIVDFYLGREKAYAPYRTEFYRESWEQAIADWWAKRSKDLDSNTRRSAVIAANTSSNEL